MSETQLHTLHMLAKRFRRHGLTLAWLKAEAQAGRLPCLRVGRRLLFDPEAVEHVLLQRARQATATVTKGPPIDTSTER